MKSPLSLTNSTLQRDPQEIPCQKRSQGQIDKLSAHTEGYIDSCRVEGALPVSSRLDSCTGGGKTGMSNPVSSAKSVDFLGSDEQTRELTKKQKKALQRHLKGEVVLISPGKRRSNHVNPSASRIMLLACLVKTLRALGCDNIEAFYTGSSVFRVLDEKGIISDRDFVVKIPSLMRLKGNASGDKAAVFTTLFSKNIESLLGISQERKYFGLSQFVCNNTDKEKWLIKLGNHDIDIVLSEDDPTYALLHQAKSIKLGDISTDSSRETESNLLKRVVNGSKQVYLADPKEVDNAIKNRWILPGGATVSWDKYGHVMKAFSQGYTFKDGDWAQRYFLAVLDHIGDAEKMGAYDLFVKFSNLRVVPILQSIFELSNQIDRLIGEGSYTPSGQQIVKKYFSILLGAVMRHLGDQRHSKLDALLSMISSWSFDELHSHTRALKNTLSIHHVLQRNEVDARQTAILNLSLMPIELPGLEQFRGSSTLYLHDVSGPIDIETYREYLANHEMERLGLTEEHLESIYTMAQQLGYTNVVEWIDHPLEPDAVGESTPEVGAQSHTALDVVGDDQSHVEQKECSAPEPEIIETVSVEAELTVAESRGVWIWDGHVYPLWDSHEQIELDDNGLPTKSVELNYLGCRLVLEQFSSVKQDGNKMARDELMAEASLYLPSFSMPSPNASHWENYRSDLQIVSSRERIRSGTYSFKNRVTLKSDAVGAIDLHLENAVLEFDRAQFKGQVAMERHLNGHLKRILPSGRGCFVADKTQRSAIEYSGHYLPTGYAVLDTKPFGTEIVELTGWWIEALQTAPQSNERMADALGGDASVTLYGTVVLVPDSVDSPHFVGSLQAKRERGGRLGCLPLEGKVFREDQPNEILQVTTLNQVTMLTSDLINGSIRFIFDAQNSYSYELHVEHHVEQDFSTSENSAKRSQRDIDQEFITFSGVQSTSTELTLQRWMADRLDHHLIEGQFTLNSSDKQVATSIHIASQHAKMTISDNRLRLDSILLNKPHPNKAVPGNWQQPYRMTYKFVDGELETIRWPVIMRHSFKENNRLVSNNTGQYFMLEYRGGFKQGQPIHQEVEELHLRGTLEILNTKAVAYDLASDQLIKELYAGPYIDINHSLRSSLNGQIPWSERVVESEIRGRTINAVWRNPWQLETKSLDPVSDGQIWGGQHNPNVIFLDPRADQLTKSNKVAITTHCMPKVVGGYLKVAKAQCDEPDIFHVANLIVMPRPKDYTNILQKGQYPLPDQWYDITAQLPKELEKAFNVSLRVNCTSLKNNLNITVKRTGAQKSTAVLLDCSEDWRSLKPIEIKGLSARENLAINYCVVAARNALLYQQTYQYLIGPSEALTKTEPQITPQLNLKGDY